MYILYTLNILYNKVYKKDKLKIELDRIHGSQMIKAQRYVLSHSSHV